MKIVVDDKYFQKYSGADLDKAREIFEDLKESAAILEEAPDYDINLHELEMIERLAARSEAQDIDLYYMYCQGFAMGRRYAKETENGSE